MYDFMVMYVEFFVVFYMIPDKNYQQNYENKVPTIILNYLIKRFLCHLIHQYLK